MKNLLIMSLICMGFISCVDTYEVSLCEKVVHDDSILGNYEVLIDELDLEDPVKAKITKEGEGYVIRYDNAIDKNEGFEVFKICLNQNNEKFFEYTESQDGETYHSYSTYEKNEKGMVISHTKFDREALDQAGIPYEREHDDLTGIDTIYVINTERDALILIESLDVSVQENLVRI